MLHFPRFFFREAPEWHTVIQAVVDQPEGHLCVIWVWETVADITGVQLMSSWALAFWRLPGWLLPAPPVWPHLRALSGCQSPLGCAQLEVSRNEHWPCRPSINDQRELEYKCPSSLPASAGWPRVSLSPHFSEYPSSIKPLSHAWSLAWHSLSAGYFPSHFTHSLQDVVSRGHFPN